MAKTLLQLSGADLKPTPLSQGVLVLIDIQNEYFDGPLRLDGVEDAERVAAGLLARARKAGTPVIHIRHKGKAGGAFDPDAPRGAIHDSVAPEPGETIIDKGLPNSYAGTTLAKALAAHPDRQPILAGFQTHMCLSATARSAVDHGAMPTVVMDAAATRALPDPTAGTELSAAEIHRAALAALADRFAVVARAGDIPD
ncbi:cysteine hydrolase [Lutimaribacter sp. EGI FJ00015]|uniref:Cysteine hydrolase n=1 Tax=Lutimaribacter degradans TaxID=2945989 RepID=A0ACC5ZX32_9RHOB|nr:cysteine hydrolase family protein [Lutimaribacter sp. EGI FJ00013]MCM2562847.1 cysteine hydrolase [Lutimaribacter sp. EGI FJ00013]MCO0614004.1 cysteine hydrolase [Lutimaribacter sp. EGI FJ00015]MCO0636976.1 cysteine hydrolase [Lutimaribacter sp. EGI FJ00014]